MLPLYTSLALCRRHYRRTEGRLKKELAGLRVRDEHLKGEDRIKWEMRECEAMKMNEVRNKMLCETRKKKVKRVITVHNEGRIFTESCLVERSPVETTLNKKGRVEQGVEKGHVVTGETNVAENYHRNGAATLGKNAEKPGPKVTVQNVSQSNQTCSIPPRSIPPLSKPSDNPPPTRHGPHRNTQGPFSTNQPIHVPPSCYNYDARQRRVLRNTRWLSYGRYNIFYPYWNTGYSWPNIPFYGTCDRGP